METYNLHLRERSTIRILRLVVFLVALVTLSPTLNKTTNAAANLNNAVQVSKTRVVRATAQNQSAGQPQQPAAKAEVVPQPQATETVNLSDHEGLMSLAGISQNDWPAVDYIISHESSWNPDATEPTTGAHGLPQALPYSKTGCGWDDAICQLRWANQYATDRYGGWRNAYYYWVAHRNW